MSRMAGALLSAALLVACQQGEAMSSPPGESDTPPSASASQQSTDKESLLTGRLGATPVEGGCAYLEAADGTRYEVIYPPGWTVDGSTATLRTPDRTVFATAGQLVTVRGRGMPEMASICQIGPIFQPTEVVSVE